MNSAIVVVLASIWKLRSRIESGEYQHYLGSVKVWRGAGLIVAPTEIDRQHLGGKVIVVTAFSQELSWLIYQLRNACAPVIDYMTKYSFYPRLGDKANLSAASMERVRRISLRISRTG